MGVRYIGSKARVAASIIDLAGDAPRGRFVDAFCGTGAVASEAASRGWSVTLNDALPSAVAMSIGATVGRGNVPFLAVGGYTNAIRLLNDIPGRPGFIHAEYSPASAEAAGLERRYFTAENAARIDAVRAEVAAWSRAGLLSELEEQLLLADLVHAANGVANIAGTYGCFLREWSAVALRPLVLRERPLPDRTTDIASLVGDVNLLTTTDEDTVYFDPPYTKRQYSAYYHVLETICAGDSPHVTGVTGLRPWRDKASDFCYKTRALAALTRLVMGTTARQILLSYSNEGHVPQDQLIGSLAEAGDVVLHEVSTIGRYRPNAKASARADSVHEYVIEIRPLRVHDQATTSDRVSVGA